MIIGREKELKLLRDSLKKDQSSFFAVYGRRRVGKTFLVDEAFDRHFTFKSAGIAPNDSASDAAKKKVQLEHFADNLSRYGLRFDGEVKSWRKAFLLLDELVRGSKDGKKVIFLDELAWMDTPQSDFLPALESFWNDWMSERKDVILIVCASSASWMMNKVIHNKGGLHNRLTHSLYIEPFTLRECELYASANSLFLSRLQVLDSYMVFGGIPLYWSKFVPGLTPEQNVDNLIFARNAEFKNEFDELYDSLFRNGEDYKKIVKALSSKRKGLIREEVARLSGLGESGSLTEKLESLEHCGIIRRYHCFGKASKDALYQLVDNFTLFYFKFMENMPNDPHFWSNNARTAMVSAWEGLAFEKVMFAHIEQIKEALGIAGVSSDVCSYVKKGSKKEKEEGSQIDLIIARKDGVIDIIEAKYSTLPYHITEAEAEFWRERGERFIESTGSKSAIHQILVTPMGADENSYVAGVAKTLSMQDLFR